MTPGPAGAAARSARSARPARLRLFDPFTTRFVNPVVLRFAGRLPGFGILGHTGRTTGRAYRAPVLVFRRGDEYVIALGSGSGVHGDSSIPGSGWTGR